MMEAQNIGRDFSRASRSYDEAGVLQLKALEHCVRILMPHLPAGSQVLDAGCGTGRLFPLSIQFRAGWKITGVDLAFGMCEQASQYPIGVINGNISALPFHEGIFDGLVTSLTLQWVENPSGALAEMRRVCRPGGFLALSCLGPRTLQELRDSFARATQTDRVNDFMPKTRMEPAARNAGWKVMAGLSCEEIAYVSGMGELFASLKGIGATNKLPGRVRGLTTPRMMNAVETHYRSNHATAEGLRVTWDLYYLLLQAA